MPISHVDVPAVPFRSPTSAAAAASRLIRSWDAAQANWTTLPRFSPPATAAVTLFRFSLFVANSHTKRFTTIVLDLTYLLTHWMCVICSQPGFLARNNWLLHFGPLRLSPFGWVSPLLLLARVPRSVRLPLCSIIFSLSHPRQVPIFSFQSGMLLTRSVVISLLQDTVRLVGLPFHSLKMLYFSHWCRLYSRCCGSARLAD